MGAIRASEPASIGALCTPPKNRRYGSSEISTSSLSIGCTRVRQVQVGGVQPDLIPAMHSNAASMDAVTTT
jgi:hypothetical protein